MKIEWSGEYPIEWKPASKGCQGKMIRITCGDEVVVLKSKKVFNHSDRGLAVYRDEVEILSYDSSKQTVKDK